MTHIYHKCHKNHIPETNLRGKKIYGKILPAPSVYYHAHKNRPQKIISFFLKHYAKRRSNEQIAGKHRNRIRKCRAKRFCISARPLLFHFLPLFPENSHGNSTPYNRKIQYFFQAFFLFHIL